jgi:hypothetical protein
MEKDNEIRRSSLSTLRIIRDLLPRNIQGAVLLALVALSVAVLTRPRQGGFGSQFVFPVCLAVFIGVLAAIITAIFDRQYVLNTFTNTVQTNLLEALDRDRSLLASGLMRAHDPFDFKLLWQSLAPADEICWLDTYCPRTNDFLALLRKALENEVQVRMLAINPVCHNARHRSLELTNTPECGPAWDTGLADFVTRMEQLRRQFPNALTIHLYEDLPGLPMYLVVRNGTPVRGYFSFFLSQPSAYFLHFELNSGKLMMEMYNYFNAKWRRAEAAAGGAAA